MDDHTVRVMAFIEEQEAKLASAFRRIDAIAFHNQRKVLQAFQTVRLSEFHFKGSTGYAYGDASRETLDAVYAEVFGAEKALVRQHFVSGTHALGAVLFGVLRPGDELISVCGAPYDTLQSVIGLGDKPEAGSLAEYGISYKEVPLTAENKPDAQAVLTAISPRTKLLLVQRSRGYAWRSALSVEEIADFSAEIKARYPHIVIFVDNCYGEFTDTREPCQVGADIVAGSLIKNPGGGIAPGGAYVVGRADLVDATAVRLTMPGLGSEMGSASGDQYRLFFQGLFLAPHIVAQALKGMQLFASALAAKGYDVSPSPGAPRNDIIQAFRLRSAEEIVRFAEAIQASSPVDSYAKPEPWDMPGYADPVVMAAGAFVQGSSIELSLDAPIRPPYTAYLQGGLTYEHAKLALVSVLQNLETL